MPTTVSNSISETRKPAPGWLAVALGAALAALIALVAAPPARQALFDSWQKLSPREIKAKDVAVVLIDEESVRQLGAWPWPRYYLARLVEKIAQDKPKVIAFDALFPEADRLNPANFAALYPELDAASAARLGALVSMDAQFAEVVGSHPLLLARTGISAANAATGGKVEDPESLLLDPEVAGKPPAGTEHFAQMLTSLRDFDDIAEHHAMINVPRDADGVYRRVPLSMMAGQRAMPGMAVELARIASGAERLDWQGRTLALGQRKLPADAQANLLVHFGKFPLKATFSASEVLDTARPLASGSFAGKVVLIGLAAEGTYDLVTTPVEPQVWGVLVQAQAADAMLTGGWLDRPAWMGGLEWALGLALAALVAGAVALKARVAQRAAAGLAGGGLVALVPASFALFAGPGLLFDPVRPGLIGLGAALGAGVRAFVRNRAERARLARELIERQVASAKQDGELAAARGIQLGMVPARDKLARLDPRLEAAGALMPALSVGGDFFDAFRVDEDRLLLVVGDVTGKGVPAALYMALSKTLAKSVLVREQGGLAHAVETLNEELLRDSDTTMGVTMLVVLVDCAQRTVQMVNAGHENPIRLKPGMPPQNVELDGGPPFCVCEFPYPEEMVVLEPGETLVLITDGVTEAQDPDGTLFGTEGAFAALADLAEAPIEVVVDTLVTRVRGFEQPADPADDLTVMAFRFREG